MAKSKKRRKSKKRAKNVIPLKILKARHTKLGNIIKRRGG